MSGAASKRRASSQAGFTLIELLVGIVLAALAVIIFYAFVVAVERSSRAQSDSAKVMVRLDAALSMVKADIRTAGYLGVPSTELEVRRYGGANVMCATPPPTVYPFPPDAIRVLPPQAPGVGYPGAFQGGTMVEQNSGLLLVGGFRVREPLGILTGNETQLGVREPRELAAVTDPVARQRAFQRLIDGGIVAISNRMGGTVYVPVGDVTAGTAVGTLPLLNTSTVMAGIVPTAGEVCRFIGLEIGGGGLIDDGMQASVLHSIRYHVMERSEAEPDAATIVADDREFVLVRDVLRRNDPAQVAQRTIVARNVIDFVVTFDQVDTTVPTSPQIVREAEGSSHVLIGGNFGTRGCGGMGCTDSIAETRPERARHAYIFLALRFDEAIEGLDEVDLGGGMTARRAVIVGEDGEATRVVIGRAEVPLTNFALASIDPRPGP